MSDFATRSARLRVMQIIHGQVHAFAPQALARHIAYRLLEGTAVADYMLGPFIIRHPCVGWPFYLAAIYLETFSLLVAFRPTLHRAWGVALILFHLGIYLTLTIMFSWEILLVGLLLVCSPFAPAKAGWGELAAQLPVWGDLTFGRRTAT